MLLRVLMIFVVIRMSKPITMHLITLILLRNTMTKLERMDSLRAYLMPLQGR